MPRTSRPNGERLGDVTNFLKDNLDRLPADQYLLGAAIAEILWQIGRNLNRLSCGHYCTGYECCATRSRGHGHLRLQMSVALCVGALEPCVTYADSDHNTFAKV